MAKFNNNFVAITFIKTSPKSYLQIFAHNIIMIMIIIIMIIIMMIIMIMIMIITKLR